MSLRQDKTRTQLETFEQRRLVKAGDKSGHADGLCWFLPGAIDIPILRRDRPLMDTHRVRGQHENRLRSAW